MTNNYDYEAAKLIIDDETNVTETNPLKDLFQICVKLVLLLASIYFFIFFSLGVIIKFLPVEKQIALERSLTAAIDFGGEKNKQKADRALRVKDNIMLADKKFPDTSNLDINVISDKNLNAVCLPDGNIYITSELYKRLTDDEMLTFVIAHEMAHYKYRDHLMSLRRNIAAGVTAVFMTVVSFGNGEGTDIVEGVLSLSDLKHSRFAEYRADKYAAKVLMKIYGRIDGGIKVLDALGTDSILAPEFLSTHPDLQRRKYELRKFEK